MSLQGQHELAEWPNRTFGVGEGAVDTVRCFDNKTGLSFEKPLTANPEKQREAEIGALRRALESVEDRERYVEEPLGWPPEDPPTAEVIARRRASLEGERQHIFNELKARGAETT